MNNTISNKISNKVSKSNGFTFIELLIAMSIFFITTTMAIPAMTSTIKDSRQNGQISTLMSHLQLARTEAIYQNKNMMMCKSNNKSHCQKNISWDQGWLIFYDENNNKQRDSDEKIVFAHGKVNHSTKILFNSFGGSKNYVSFYSRGYSHTNGTFTVCHPLGINRTKTIVVSRTGRVRLNEMPNKSYQKKCLPYI